MRINPASYRHAVDWTAAGAPKTIGAALIYPDGQEQGFAPERENVFSR
jgi:hypothetical protein